MHPTYKHLEARIRLAGLTVGQWAQLLASAVAAYGLAHVLPLPGSWSVSVAVTVCGLPAATAIAVMQHDFDVVVWLRAAVRFVRAPERYRAGVRPWAPGLADDGAFSAAGDALAVDRLWDPR